MEYREITDHGPWVRVRGISSFMLLLEIGAIPKKISHVYHRMCCTSFNTLIGSWFLGFAKKIMDEKIESADVNKIQCKIA